jgi:hypothetical protein
MTTLTNKLSDPDEDPEKIKRQIALLHKKIESMEPMPVDPEMKQYYKKLQKKMQPNPQLVELIRLKINIKKNAAVGVRELRLGTKTGFSSPVYFVVGEFPEILEKEPNDKMHKTEAVYSLPAVFNGQIMPGDIDFFRFKAKKDQQLVFAVKARDLVPYLADAVPGWFQAVISVFDESGKEVAYADDFYGRPDPVLCFTVPEDGVYTLKINDSIYRGRQDFVYRISSGEMPYITSIFPLGGKTGVDTEVSLTGYNLKEKTTVISGTGHDGDILYPSIMHNSSVGASLRFLLSGYSEKTDIPGNDSFKAAQKLSSPMMVNGKIESQGDIDVFAVVLKKNETFIAETFARRLGSPLDSELRLYSKDGVTVASNDDYVDKIMGFDTHHADSRLSFNVQKAGTYFLVLRDIQNNGGEHYAYRLKISGPAPGFDLRATPSSVIIPADGIAVMTIHAVRRDGFNGEINIELNHAPDGFVMHNGVIAEGKNSIRVTIAAPRSYVGEIIYPEITGIGKANGKNIIRKAKAADDVMQAFLYRHLLQTETLMFSVIRGPKQMVVFDNSDPIVLTPGKDLKIPFELKNTVWIDKFNAKLTASLDAPPKGVHVTETVFENGEGHFVVSVGKKDIVSGDTGNLIFKLSAVTEPIKNKKGKKSSRQRSFGLLPAVQYIVQD